MASMAVDFIMAALGNTNVKGTITFLYFSSPKTTMSKVAHILTLISGISKKRFASNIMKIYVSLWHP
jgi:hypothetical protein